MRGYQASLIGLALFLLTQGVIAAENTIHLIVKYKQQTVNQLLLKKELSQLVNLPITSLKPMAGGAYTLTYNSQALNATHSEDATAIILEKLRNDPRILYAVKDRVGYFHPPVQTTDESFSANLLSHDSQWDEFLPPAGMMLESAPGLRDGAWSYTSGKAEKPVIVAVLDTGIALNKDLINNLVKNEQGEIWGWNFAANNRELIDETKSYHGTHVAGTIAAQGDVMLGVGEHLKVLPLKIVDASGMFYESQVINAIHWSVGEPVPNLPHNPYPAKVLNMSFGVDERPGKEIDHCDEALQDALFTARKRGAVVIAAAGNDNRWEHYNAPAVCNSVLKIASTGPEGLRSYFSNYGPSISFAAPGGDLHYGKKGGILSTVNPGGGYQGSGFDFYQGTSMASPHAAGVAGLVVAAGKGVLKPEQVEQILYATTHNFGQTKEENKSCLGKKPCGSGILNAEKAVAAALAEFDLITSIPSGDNLSLSACDSTTYQLKEQSIQKSDANWLKIKSSCQLKAAYAQPRLQQKKDGKIVLSYGEAYYRFDDSAFKYCELIGNKGIGCYR